MSEDYEELKQHTTRLRDEVNNWFDKHPEPYNIDCHSFRGTKGSGIKKVNVYFADKIHDCYQVRIECNSAKTAEFLNRLYYKTTCQMGITQILINKELFFLRSFF